ncbi:GNAT family N-acetyltransferase [Clostridioides difficile]|nr:GNAT family N-acetyltransferase [Clostridioides difficile]MDV9711269.1 GNAT family N-acetyltransferase [Clostridioides difficile]
MDNIIIREMVDDERRFVWELGKSSFGLVESLAFRKPKKAFIAIVDGHIVGMASYRIFPAKNNQTVGYLETAYVKKGYEGQGIGSELYKKVTIFLKEQGCKTVTATVKDDNVASWKLFENNGYNIMSLTQMLQNYGLIGTIQLWIYSTLFIASGFHLWSTSAQKSNSSIKQLGVYLILNLLILLPILLFDNNLNDFTIIVGAFFSLLITSLISGLLATLILPEKWVFTVTRGGLFISLLITVLGGIWPMIGRFYPKEYKSTDIFKRSMAIEGLFEWLGLLCLILLVEIFARQLEFCEYIVSLGKSLLILHSIPFYPFECFGGKRIWNYSKILSIITIVISIGMLYLF